MENTLTNERITVLLRTNDRAVGRAILALYKLQTLDERRIGTTKYSNTVGFSAAHASRGSYYARWIGGGKQLTGRHLDNARKMVLHYHRYLLALARGKDPATCEPE